MTCTRPLSQILVALISLRALNLVELAGLGKLGHYTENSEALFRLIGILRVIDILGSSLTHHVAPLELLRERTTRK